MRNVNKYILSLITLIWLFLSPSLYSQPTDPAETDPDTPAVPIDGGASLLVALGAALGVKKLSDFKKSKVKQ